jgi:hypothetical protein
LIIVIKVMSPNLRTHVPGCYETGKTWLDRHALHQQRHSGYNTTECIQSMLQEMTNIEVQINEAWYQSRLERRAARAAGWYENGGRAILRQMVNYLEITGR